VGKSADYIFEHQDILAEHDRKEDLMMFQIEVTNSVKSVGIKGGQFFTITYEFIGTVTHFYFKSFPSESNA